MIIQYRHKGEIQREQLDCTVICYYGHVCRHIYGRSTMKVGNLIKIYGHPGFYGVLLHRVESEFFGKWWKVHWQSGYVSDHCENLMEVVA